MSGKENLRNPPSKGVNNGFVNGLTNGLTNGNGKTNGLVNGNNGSGNKKKGIMETTKGRMGVWAVVGVVLLLIFGAFAFSTNFLKGINWNTVKKYVDVDLSKIDNPNVNITNFAFHQGGGYFYFYIEFADKFSKTTTDYKNLAYILIEDDSRDTPKYNGEYIHPNYIIKLSGAEGAVTGSFMKYNGTGDDWNWVVEGGVSVVEKGNVVQGQISEVFGSDTKIMVIAQNYYTQDITPVVGIEKPALLVVQGQNDDKLNLRLVPLYGDVDVKEIIVDTSKNVKLTNAENLKDIGKISSEKMVDVDVYPLSNGSALAQVKDVDSSTKYVTIWGSEFKKYYGNPRGIVIDGIFNDWKKINKKTPVNHVDNPNIDVEKYANTTYSGNNYFYLSVRGSMLNGNIAPEIEKVKSTGGGGGGGESKGRSPYDYAEIDIYTKGGGHHTIKIIGYNGIVIKKLLDGKDAGNMVSVGVGRDGNYGALELELKASYSIESYTIKMTDWSNTYDIATSTTILIAMRHASITVDGDPSDWTGNAPSQDNTFAISNGEFIWKDATGDERTDNSNTYDITEFRITSDGTYLYFLVKFNELNGIGSDGAPGIMITMRTDSSGSGTYFAYNSDTQVAQDGEANWNYQLAFDLANSGVSDGSAVQGDGNQVWNGGSAYDLLDTNWNDISTSSDEFVASSTYNDVEAKVLLSEIGNPTQITFELGMVRCNPTGDAWDVSEKSDIMDAMTTATSTEDSVGDGYVDYYVTITFDNSQNGDVTQATQGGSEVPEISPTLMMLLMPLSAIPVVHRYRKEKQNK